ncbi:MAG: hypothetical protein R3A12_06220 [Ignavibacteria bacterium]
MAQTICGKRTAYDPGIWFNSAKFLDIEYQTAYGLVNMNIDGEKIYTGKIRKTEKRSGCLY